MSMNCCTTDISVGRLCHRNGLGSLLYVVLALGILASGSRHMLATDGKTVPQMNGLLKTTMLCRGSEIPDRTVLRV